MGLGKLALIVLLALGSMTCGSTPENFPQGPFQLSGKAFNLSLLSWNILSDFDLKSMIDGYPPWAVRRGLLFNQLLRHKADIMAFQEASPIQAMDLSNYLPGYYKIQHNQETDVLIYYRHAKLKLQKSGYWPLPKARNRLGRIAIWALFQEKKTQREFMVFNTHFDASKTLKKKAAAFLSAKIKTLPEDLSIFLLGDLNMGLDQTAYIDLKNIQFLSAVSTETEANYTYETLEKDRQVDHILYRGDALDLEAGSIIKPPASYWTSDHLAPKANFKFREQ